MPRFNITNGLHIFITLVHGYFQSPAFASAAGPPPLRRPGAGPRDTATAGGAVHGAPRGVQRHRRAGRPAPRQRPPCRGPPHARAPREGRGGARRRGGGGLVLRAPPPTADDDMARGLVSAHWERGTRGPFFVIPLDLGPVSGAVRHPGQRRRRHPHRRPARGHATGRRRGRTPTCNIHIPQPPQRPHSTTRHCNDQGHFPIFDVGVLSETRMVEPPPQFTFQNSVKHSILAILRTP